MKADGSTHTNTIVKRKKREFIVLNNQCCSIQSISCVDCQTAEYRNVASQSPTFFQQLVGLAHPVLDEALAVVQRFDAVRLDGVDLGQQRGQPLRQQPTGRRLQLSEVPPQRLAGLTRATPHLKGRGNKDKGLLHLLIILKSV